MCSGRKREFLARGGTLLEGFGGRLREVLIYSIFHNWCVTVLTIFTYLSEAVVNRRYSSDPLMLSKIMYLYV